MQAGNLEGWRVSGLCRNYNGLLNNGQLVRYCVERLHIRLAYMGHAGELCSAPTLQLPKRHHEVSRRTPSYCGST